MIDQMGHAWSGGSPNGSFTDSSGPNATEIIWNFLSNKQQQPEEKQIETQVQNPISDTSGAGRVSIYSNSN